MAAKRARFAQTRRMAGYTQERLAEVLGVDSSTVRRWEAGDSEPLPHVRPKLVELLGVSASELAHLLEADSRLVASVVDLDASGEPALMTVLDRARLLVDQTLSTGSASITRVALIEERVAEHVLTYTRTAPVAVLRAVVPDLVEVGSMAAERQPAGVQARLSEATAVLGLLSADALMKLGEINRARYWYGTARLAADDTANPRLQAQVRAQEAMLPYYYGRLEQSVGLARSAQALLPRTACSATALASAAEGRALARLGDREGADHAMRRAQRMVDELDEPTTDAAFQFNDKRLLLYLSATFTYLGETKSAGHVQAQALERYGQEPSIAIDPALIQLDQAVGAAVRGEAEEVCELAVRTIELLPPEHRTRIVLTRALDVVAAIPAAHQQRPAAVELRELVTRRESPH
ncbi:helix-turn-helix domain-containing protein [Saccharothrix sp. S26]|uniref:helix-turn-helix domain-containing protein n=1 Tax=Saccharothrix sp. S26 TaxID=2907215 RepID=UPI001F16DB04|nr:helix-turn-helix transcriptional regulator [Saccharothrix sp. S26]MCE6997763.1 helix-turn-helix domain-containing protein [Saccharothrix sp. S26]